MEWVLEPQHLYSHLVSPPTTHTPRGGGGWFSAAHFPIHPVMAVILAPGRGLGKVERAGVGCT